MVTAHHRHPLRLGGPWLLSVLVYLLLWGSPGAWANYLRRSSSCTSIPARMALCYDIGYSEMRIPNLLEHETMPEVIQQSSSWLPLLARECHPDTRIFLCSLFASICLDRLIYPCHSLCEAIKRSCTPVMACYGYSWPEILSCNKFPADHELCIAAVFTDENSSSRRIPRASCKDCELEEASTAREILENLCANDFGTAQKPHTGVFVVSGEVQGDNVVVNKSYAWQKKNRKLDQAVWRWKHHRCPEQAG